MTLFCPQVVKMLNCNNVKNGRCWLRNASALLVHFQTSEKLKDVGQNVCAFIKDFFLYKDFLFS